VNRDARMLATPEARILKAAQERVRPAYGFNLHDQNVRARVGDAERTAAFALLAPAPDATGRPTPAMRRAMELAAIIRRAVDPLVPGHVTRYDDSYNPRAFGDGMQHWGVATVLLESGGWRDDPEKQHLRRTNFVAILAALDAIAAGAADADVADDVEAARAADATRRWRPGPVDVRWYTELPQNGANASDLLVLGGTVVAPGMPPYRADLAIDFVDPLLGRAGRITDVGDLADAVGRATLAIAGLFLHFDGRAPAPGVPASFTVRQGADGASPAVWVVEEGGVRRP
jgi:hypothetical protein